MVLKRRKRGYDARDIEVNRDAGLFSGRDDEPKRGGKFDSVEIEDVLASSHLNLPRSGAVGYDDTPGSTRIV